MGIFGFGRGNKKKQIASETSHEKADEQLRILERKREEVRRELTKALQEIIKDRHHA